MINITFLIIGLIIGFIFGFILDLLREKRLKTQCWDLISTEIETCYKDLKEDFVSLQKFKESNIPTELKNEKIFLSSFLLSKSMYITDIYNSYVDRLHVFGKELQREIRNFFGLIIKIKMDLKSLQILIGDSKIPNEFYVDHFKKQCLLRGGAMRTAKRLKSKFRNNDVIFSSGCRKNVALILCYILFTSFFFLPYSSNSDLDQKKRVIFTPVAVYKRMYFEKIKKEYIEAELIEYESRKDFEDPKVEKEADQTEEVDEALDWIKDIKPLDSWTKEEYILHIERNLPFEMTKHYVKIEWESFILEIAIIIFAGGFILFFICKFFRRENL